MTKQMTAYRLAFTLLQQREMQLASGMNQLQAVLKNPESTTPNKVAAQISIETQRGELEKLQSGLRYFATEIAEVLDEETDLVSAD